MSDFDLKGSILKLISSNKKGVTKDNIIEYLDFINKVRYSEEEIDEPLKELKQQNRVKYIGKLWYPPN